MKLFRFLAISFLGSCFAIALAQYPQAWSVYKDLAQLSRETAREIVAVPGGGGYFICGTDGGSTVLAKVSDTGSVLWSRSVQGDYCDMAVSTSGIAVAGKSSGQQDPYLNSFWPCNTVERFDLNGNLLWSKSMIFPQASADVRVAIDGAGNVFAEFPGVDADFLMKFDATTGSQVFKVSTPQSISSSLITDNVGNVYLTQYVIQGNTGIALTKYNASGNVLWAKSYTGNYPLILFDSSTNPVLIFNIPYGGGVQIFKLDANGNVVWNSTDPATGATSAFISQSGSIFMIGGGDQDFGMGISKFNSNGQFQWKRTAGWQGSSFTVDANDNATIVYEDYDQTLGVQHFDANGNSLWTVSRPLPYSHSSEFYTSTIADSLGRVILFYQVTGSTGSLDFGVSAISPNGASVWELDYDAHKSFDQAFDSVTDPNGNTYVMGRANGYPGTCGVVRVSSAGGVNWSRILPTAPASVVFPVTPRLTPDNGVVIGNTCDESNNSGNGTGFCAQRFNSAGNLIWSYSGGSLLSLLDIGVANDGAAYLVIGKQPMASRNIDTIRIVKIMPNGVVAWTSDRPGGASRTVHGPRIAIDASGSVYAGFRTLHSGSTFHYDTSLNKFDSSGNFLWATPIMGDDPYDDISPDGVALDSTGSPYMLTNNFDMPEILTRLDPDTGAIVWGIPMQVYRDEAQLTIDSLDNVFVGGESAFSWRPEIQKVTTQGTILWSKITGDEDDTEPFRMVPDGSGGAFFACHVYDHPNVFTGTMIGHFNSDGSLPWPSSGGAFINGTIHLYSGVTQHKLAGIGTDSSGNLYVTGSAYPGSNTGSYDFNVVKYASINSAFVTQSVPSSMIAGQTYAVSATFQNTGFDSWSNASSYKLNATNASTWGITGAPLSNGESILPGQTRKFSFNIYAPVTPGSYTFQTKMYKNGSSFGALSTAVLVNVTLAADASRYVSQSEPGAVTAGSTFTVKVDMRNVGSNTWTQAGGYVLVPAAGYPTWNVTTVPLGVADSIAKGSDKVFLFSATAPPTPGTYNIRFQMKKGSSFFGDRTTLKSIIVTP